MKARLWVLPFVVASAVALGLAYQPLTAFEGELMTLSRSASQTSGDELSALAYGKPWLNSAAPATSALRGKVVLVNFWTYTCINWQRQLPYVRAWAAKYKDKGLVVIGAHTPEFEFEKNVDNIRRAVAALDVPYSVAVDSDYAIWNAFGNRYWPALYFIDAKGQVRHRQFGEGDYGQSEKVIQQLLSEAGAQNVASDLVAVKASGSQAGADWSDLQSPETYLGYERAENFASDDAALDKPAAYTLPTKLHLNQWALSGEWTIKGQGAALTSAGGRVAFRFHARDLHLVMGPSSPGKSIRFRVRIDGQSPGVTHGADVDAEGNGTLSEQRLYQLIRQQSPIADRTFEIEFLDPGAEAFVFTFG